MSAGKGRGMETFDQIGTENYKEIKLTDFEGLRIGHATDEEHGTGCSVLICPEGMGAGVDVRGGGPASRELALLDPTAACEFVHALVLSGGSAYGLNSAGGVMQYLEEQGIGFSVVGQIVPLVVGSCIFDLGYGDGKVRPDHAMGYQAAKDSEHSNISDGNIGAGCGATVGKICGADQMMKAGLGSYAIQMGKLKIGAIIAVNSLGDIYDHVTGKKIAGLLNPEKTEFVDSEEAMAKFYTSLADFYKGNTAIGAVITNAQLPKPMLQKVAAHGQNALARCIRPVHTMADGDTVYGLSIPEKEKVTADVDLVGALGAIVMAEAIKRAVMAAKTSHGVISATDFLKK